MLILILNKVCPTTGATESHAYNHDGVHGGNFINSYADANAARLELGCEYPTAQFTEVDE